ncbi:hypothetical protein [Heyndrickxia sporothermodurans]|uniref:hypothetical protein n=1 Tax=Heyndrickxia sporothermodurans TaxID=46224 RepID=UPI000D3CE9A5|nr:hypothetical protein [Heyndrickxia sporothermodurans]PTY93004.1 hypothetical protein B5V90_02675 [Heyndrickxia sporothermodurans]
MKTKADCAQCNKDAFFCDNCGGLGPFTKALREECPVKKHKSWSEFGYKLPKEYNPYYIYFVKEFVATLDRKSQVAYYHHIANIPKHHTLMLLSMTERQLEHLMDDIYRNALKFLQENEDMFRKNKQIYIAFYDMLLDESIDEEKIAKWFNVDIASIKVSRVFALQASKL